MNASVKSADPVSVGQAKTTLSKLIAAAEAGEEVVISRGKVPVVKLVPVAPVAKPKRVPGSMKGLIALDDSFFDPLPDDELAMWGTGDAAEADVPA
ncbi:type II toxin-antitoxin system Phd/YefM family antitoxin [Sandaracinobacteroides saxicola]|uniref:Type II toxin-antitoxin system prevent-host-death family antitoxin n=1 Tax=Sandaracinobacteroides saxicola TaxID=2759707 RepID=A0A7G5IF72_9SPHN|nr:type II toxin-antitoxin system prevent-host-death family antitoxin [Sandaracinobacteroides saxicola]QMW22014.1 type II toxin-antitoxin system prevent-host-death family antitoxin [Sandaracinobacteroides saxicola]